MTTEIPVPAYVPPAGKRLFVGIRVSVATTNALAAAVETLVRRAKDAPSVRPTDLRWVAPTSYHITLKYLGFTHVETVGAVCDSLDTAVRGVQRFGFRVARLGAFDSLDQARVLWAGVEDDRPLVDLATRIETAMVELGFQPDRRPFKPHVTLARLPETRALRDLVLPSSEQMFSETKVDGVTLFESETKPTGSVHTEIRKITFKPAETAIRSGSERQTPALDLSAPRETQLSSDTDDGWPRGQGPTELGFEALKSRDH
ncbi:MAG: RNA 2',3'-cyclic phosphodiesterase [Deltaproteobacteria bacterium]|nr:RNA 2',3'-cyclic phosphodiesterase [Deltaproteobacteria bacterium]